MQDTSLVRPDEDDARRKALLEQFAILDTPQEERFDRIAHLACRMTGAPIALVTLADTNRIWFKAHRGLDICELPTELAFCPHALDLAEALEIEDTTADPRFADNPLVTGEAHIRFYAGAQLRTTEGVVLGTLCILDRQPRRLSADQIASLEDLAQCVIAELELRRMGMRLRVELAEQRRLACELHDAQDRLEDFLAATSDMLWETDASLELVFGGGGRIEGFDFETIQGLPLDVVANMFPLTRAPNIFFQALRARQPFRHVQLGRRNEDGGEIWIEASGRPVFRDDVFQGYRGVTRDIGDRKRAEQKIRRLAEEDPLTGLPNRRLFQKRLAETFADIDTLERQDALLLLDIDRFKTINDEHGHDVGDRVITEVGQRIASVIRENDLVARLGGDEFAIILRNAVEAQLTGVAERIIAAMREPIATADGEIIVTVSAGAVLVPRDAFSAEMALKRADVALYRAKHDGRGRYAMFAEPH